MSDVAMREGTELLVRYGVGVDPVMVGSTLLTVWSKSEYERLFRMGKDRELVPATLAIIRQHLRFKPQAEDVSLRLRTSRARTAIVVEFYFTNPDWNYSRPANYCAIRFPNASSVRMDNFSALAVLEALADAGPLQDGQIESQQILDAMTFEDHNKQDAGDVGPLHSVAVIPASRSDVIASIEGALTIKALRSGAIIVALSDTFPTPGGVAAISAANRKWRQLTDGCGSRRAPEF